MRKVFKLIEQVSANDVAVLIRGESGTGKELVAHAIHKNSARKNHPFLAINCAALPENLLESELFGYEKGAFTGAQKQKPGQFENAHRGTLFLDEIGDLSLSLQAKLLRVLQNNQITRLGGKDQIQIDVRLITATHRNLEEMIEEKLFRSDLFYRINIVPIFLPPLRERKEDIPELIQFFMGRFPDKEMSTTAKRLLMEYEFPGNVRELENIISREGIISEHVIDHIDLPHTKKTTEPLAAQKWKIPEDGIKLDEVERLLIDQALSMAEGNKSRAAQLLGITRRKLYSMMERFGMDI
jgi:transcriptional regulator with PAS, ATPase and Fis domain